MKSVVLVKLLFGSYGVLFSSCCSDDSVKVSSSSSSTFTASISVKSPSASEMYQADLFIKRFKEGSPKAVAYAQDTVGNDPSEIDKFIIRSLLMSQAKHIEPISGALKFKLSEK